MEAPNHASKGGNTVTAPPNPTASLAATKDRAEQRRIEEELRKSEARYRDLVENASVWIWETDCKIHHVYTNAFVTICLGYRPEEFLAADTLDLVHPDDREALAETARRAVEEGKGWRARVFRWRHQDGSWRHIESSGTPAFDAEGNLVGLRGVDQDVTERVRAEEELRRSEAFLRESQEVACLGTYVFEVAEDTWRSSEILDRLFGIDAGYRRDATGWLDLVHPDDRDAMRRHLVEHVLRDRRPFDRDYRIVRRSDGEVRWVHGMGRLDFDAGGAPVRLVGTIQDITERKRAGAERLELERRLLHAQKLESLGVLAGGIAHDFNNLLMAILGNLDMARTRVSPVSPAVQNLEQALQATQRAADLARQMLAYSGKGAFVVKRVDLSEVVAENAHLLSAVIPKNVVLSIRPERLLPRVEADPTQLQQVIMNLITNAAEAIGEKVGTITLSTGFEEADAFYLKQSRAEEIPPPGTYAYVQVTDTGCGMDLETRRRLFDPFFSTKTMGRGLGMSSILGIVRGHRGAILVDSAVGRGTTIRVLFPAAEPVPQPAETTSAEEPAPRAPPFRAQRTALLVDDEEIVRTVTAELLAELGMRVLTARDGEDALAVFRREASVIDVVLLDLSMPKMDGTTAGREMLGLRPDVRIVLVSGYHERELAGRASGDSFAAFLQKPYTLGGLRTVLERVLAEPA